MSAEIEFLALPFAAAENRSLVHVLSAEFRKRDWSHFRAAIAFARFSGSYVELFDAMQQFAQRGGRIDLTFGADKFSGDGSGSEYAAVQEVLARLGAESSVNVYLYHEIGRTFHPKIYVFNSDDRALVIVGSSNWSDGGFCNNVEANLVARLDLRNAANRKCFADIRNCFDQHWATGRGFSRRVTLNNLADFAPLLSIGSASHSGQTGEDDPELDRAESLFRGKRVKVKTPFTRVATTTTPSPATGEEALAGVLPGESLGLRDLFDNANQFFLCNTDRSHSDRTAQGGYDLEELMWSTGYAAAWERFAHTSHIERVEPGDAIFMYANKLGVIGIGQAKAKCESKIPPEDSIRIYNGSKTPTPEWRVPVKWLYWDRNRPCPWPLTRYPTFLDVTKDDYADSRQGVREFVLND